MKSKVKGRDKEADEEHREEYEMSEDERHEPDKRREDDSKRRKISREEKVGDGDGEQSERVEDDEELNKSTTRPE